MADKPQEVALNWAGQLSDDEFEKCQQILAHGARLRLNGGATDNSWLPSISEVATSNMVLATTP